MADFVSVRCLSNSCVRRFSFFAAVPIFVLVIMWIFYIIYRSGALSSFAFIDISFDHSCPTFRDGILGFVTV